MFSNEGATGAVQPQGDGSIRWRFSRKALVWALVLLSAEVLIATLGAPYPWLRGFFGDLLAVVWLYFVFRTALAGPTWVLALAAFSTGCLLELGQYVASVNGWQLGHPLLRILLGSVPDWLDVLAYAAGFLLVMRFAPRH